MTEKDKFARKTGKACNFTGEKMPYLRIISFTPAARKCHFFKDFYSVVCVQLFLISMWTNFKLQMNTDKLRHREKWDKHNITTHTKAQFANPDEQVWVFTLHTATGLQISALCLFLSIQSNRSLLISHWMTAESFTLYVCIMYIILTYHNYVRWFWIMSNSPAFSKWSNVHKKQNMFCYPSPVLSSYCSPWPQNAKVHKWKACFLFGRFQCVSSPQNTEEKQLKSRQTDWRHYGGFIWEIEVDTATVPGAVSVPQRWIPSARNLSQHFWVSGSAIWSCSGPASVLSWTPGRHRPAGGLLDLYSTGQRTAGFSGLLHLYHAVLLFSAGHCCTYLLLHCKYIQYKSDLSFSLCFNVLYK